MRRVLFRESFSRRQSASRRNSSRRSSTDNNVFPGDQPVITEWRLEIGGWRWSRSRIREEGRRKLGGGRWLLLREGATKWKASLPRGTVLSPYPFPVTAKEEGRKRVRNNIHYSPELSVIRDRSCRSRS